MRGDDSLKKLSALIDSVFSKDVYFDDNTKVRTLLRNNCSSLVLLDKFKLRKLPRVKIDKQYVFIFKDDVHQKEKFHMCTTLSKHYKTILKLVYGIKLIYDSEYVGANSIAGIVNKNMNFTKTDEFEILFCSSKQTSYGSTKLDFSNLTGLQFFIDEILSASEKTRFLNQFQSMLNSPKQNAKKLEEWICSDILVPQHINEKLHQTTVSCGGKIMLTVREQNPIFSSRSCATLSKYKVKTNKQILKELRNFENHYDKNLTKLSDILNQIIRRDNKNKVFITDLSYPFIKQIERSFKINVIVFFMQSIADYKNIFNIVKAIKPNES
jgi:hypothetical protein